LGVSNVLARSSIQFENKPNNINDLLTKYGNSGTIQVKPLEEISLNHLN